MSQTKDRQIPAWISAIAAQEAERLYDLAPTQFKARSMAVERLRSGIEELLTSELAARAA